MMGTPLQEVYDSFFIKVPEDFTYKNDMVFQLFKAGYAKSYQMTSSTVKYSISQDSGNLVLYSTAQEDGKIQIYLNEENMIEVELSVDNTKDDIAKAIRDGINNTENFTAIIKFIENPIIEIKNTEEDGIVNLLFVDYDGTKVEIAELESYAGYFDTLVHQDYIELIALNMALEFHRRNLYALQAEKQHIGTKEFNRLPEKSREMSVALNSIENLIAEIEMFKSDFQTYGKQGRS